MQAASIRVREDSDELALIAQRAQALTHSSGTAIALSEGNADEIICRARAGSCAPEVGTALRVDGTFTGLCIQSGEELWCDDAEIDTRVDKVAIRALGIRSIVAVPIKEHGRVVGVLAVFATSAHAFTITHVGVLKTIAGQIAAYLERQHPDEACSSQPLPAPPMKAIATAASPASPTAFAMQPAAAASKPRQLPVSPKVEPARDTTFAETSDPAPLRKQKKTASRAGQKEHKIDFRRAFSTLDAVAAHKDRPGANLLMIGAVALVVIAVAVGLSFELRRPAAAPQPTQETPDSPGPLVTPAPASVNVQPPAKTSPLGPSAKHNEAASQPEEADPKSEVTVVLSARPSRISPPQPANGARVGDASALSSDSPVILGSVPGSGSLSNLPSPVSRSRVVTQSNLEPATVIKKVQPVYPPGARQQGLSGSVVVQGTVDRNGRISELRMLSGPPLFRNAAFEAVKQWVFKPATLNGQAIEQSTTIRLDFGAQ